VRDEARRVREEVTGIRAELAAAARSVQQAEHRAEKAERRVAKLTSRLQKSAVELRRARQSRDEAQRLLRLKLAAAKDVDRFRTDPDALLAIIAEQRQVLTRYRARVAQLDRAQLLRSITNPYDDAAPRAW
jgi:hypothetical protein